jgi:8-oxo-dGTP pyrophosphatase MutT (NUDIX family)
MMAAFWDDLRARLSRITDSPPAAAPWREAAVLVPLYEAGGEIFVLLTRRTETVEHHKGQISFPGGAANPGEDLRQTALRETFEEVGIPPDQVEVLGRLPDVEVTVSGFRVTPFVGVIPAAFPLRPNTAEIEEVVRVPLAAFRDGANLRIELLERAGRPAEIYHYTHGAYTIWGATARIVRHLVHLLDQAG